MSYSAQQLSAYGRNGDSTLMHVNPREVQGIAALLNRPVTRNPNTGLPEAFGWTDILPVVAGLAATVATGGAAAPVAGALAAGATKTAMTGDLGQGVLTGMTAYATAGLAGGLAEAGAGAAASAAGTGAAEAAGAGAAQTAASTAGAGAAQTAVPAATGAAQGAISAEPLAQTAVPASFGSAPTTSWGTDAAYNASYPAPTNINVNPTIASVAPAPAPTPSAGPAAPSSTPISPTTPSAASMSRGEYASNLGRAISDPSVAGGYIAKHPGQAGLAAFGAYSSLSGAGEPSSPPVRRQQVANFNPTPPGTQWTPPPVGYRPSPLGVTRMAEGGIAEIEGGDGRSLNAARNLIAEARMALRGEHPRPREALARFAATFGEHALVALQRQEQSGGMVQGAGGGLDDLVPGSIEGRQDVRLADGEYVWPADAVSALGDGSTDHGARRLDEMISRLRKEKYGRDQQPGRANPDALMESARVG